MATEILIGTHVNSLSQWALAVRKPLRRALLVTAVVLPVLCLLGALSLWGGAGERVPALGDRAPAAARFLALYAAPLLLAAPLWARMRLAQLEALPATARVLDAAVLVLSLARFLVGAVLPFSGHTLFLAYTTLVTRRARTYQLVALALLIETTIFKLAIWRDVRSWALGLALGSAAAVCVLVASRRAAT